MTMIATGMMCVGGLAHVVPGRRHARDAVGAGAGGAGHGGDGRPDGRHLVERGVRARVAGGQGGIEPNGPAVSADLAAVPDAIGRHALRIVQEALTNARKHATSAPVELRLDGAPAHGLEIDVRNPASALATAEPKIPGTGAGLLGLAERAALSGGRLEHGLDEHGDFRLHAWLPWPQ
jgi:hypothetical protein